MKLSAYETYCLFLALKFHFTQEKYDFVKYQGKTRTSLESFESRRDRFQFQKLSKKYDDNELKDLFISNILVGRSWIGDFLDEEAHSEFIAYTRRKQSIMYTFKNEVELLFKGIDNPSNIFQVQSGQYPKLINHHMSGDISLESLVILNRLTEFYSRFDDKIGKDDLIWSKLRMKILKLECFIDYDFKKAKSILKSIIENINT